MDRQSWVERACATVVPSTVFSVLSLDVILLLTDTSCDCQRDLEGNGLRLERDFEPLR